MSVLFDVQRLPPLSTDPDRCERAFVGNTICQANGVYDKAIDLRFCDYTNEKSKMKGKSLAAALMSDAKFDGADMSEIVIGNLSLKFPTASKPTFSGVHPSSSPCYCKIKFKNFTSQTTTIPLILNEAAHPEHPNSIMQSASF
ncbi:hypothetical protein QQ045_013281 [Rhodiola kirilowii]